MLFVKRWLVCFAVVFIFSLFFVSASGNVVLRTVPAKSIWVADGTTQYRMDVYADATSYSGPVKALFWSFAVPHSSYLHLVSSSLPTNNYFYNSWAMENEQITSTVDGGFVRFNALNAIDDGPIGRSGYLGSYWFTVDSGAPRGWASFDFENDHSMTYFIDSTSTQYQFYPDLESVSFRIVPKSTQLPPKVIAIPDETCNFPNC